MHGTMEKGNEPNKEKGIIAGWICFSAFMVPWLFFLLLDTIDTGYMAGLTGEKGVWFFTGIGIFILISGFFGFSMSKKSRLLKVLSSLFVAAVPTIWIILFIVNSFSK
jgi:LPXTG-motif cell wall-anchored protein